jgi:hypothetical protein
VNKSERILKLRAAGMGYKKIAKALALPISVVRYYASPRERARVKDATTDFRKKNPLKRKLYKLLSRKMMNYSRGRGDVAERKLDYPAIIARLILSPVCYLTGEKLDLSKPETYQLDHKMPVCRGGDSLEQNIGLTTRWANQSKLDLTPEEFIDLCKKVLEYNGFSVRECEVAE